jgi:hypothetical protein
MTGTLRHTFGKRRFDAGEDLVTVATLMGHKALNYHLHLHQSLGGGCRQGGGEVIHRHSWSVYISWCWRRWSWGGDKQDQ